MKLNFQFSNLLGSVYGGEGNVLFTPDGNSLISPIGKKITVFDLINNKSFTLSCEALAPIKSLTINPQGSILISVDEKGGAMIVNFHQKTILSYEEFGRGDARQIKFSPDGKYFAVNSGSTLKIWKSPPAKKEFSPFKLYKTFKEHHATIKSIYWSKDSKYIVTGSVDLTIKIMPMSPPFDVFTLAGHSTPVVGAFFADNKTIYSVDEGGLMYSWEFLEQEFIDPTLTKKRKIEKTEDDVEDAIKEDHENLDDETNEVELQTLEKVEFVIGELSPHRGRWNVKKSFQVHGNVTSCDVHSLPNRIVDEYLFVLGFRKGDFAIYELPNFAEIHTLNISTSKIQTVSINSTGEWIAFGSSIFGQLLVWEWQSETYVMKQQGHSLDMSALAYSPDGTTIVTGGDDGKVKMWNASSGFCFVTFVDHTGPVTGVTFLPNGTGVLSSSADGTVRAFDLTRYRNFRVLTAADDTPIQFHSVVVDPAGEIVCAASKLGFEIYVWSLQTGKLLEVLNGHEAPVSCLAFHPTSPILASVSWDKTCRIWEVYESDTPLEAFEHKNDLAALCFKPDGKELATSSLDGVITFWNTAEATSNGEIEGKRDIAASSSPQLTKGKYFMSICYSADGSVLMAGGNNMVVCFYDVKSKILLRRTFLNQNPYWEFASYNGNENKEKDDYNYIPGVKKGDLSKRKVRTENQLRSAFFSPTNRSWAAATAEGMMIYSLDQVSTFDPYELEIEITPKTTYEAVENKEYLKALVMCFKLNQNEVTTKVIEDIPTNQIQLIANSFPANYVQRLLIFIAEKVEKSNHLEFYMLWVIHLFRYHGHYLIENQSTFSSQFRSIQKNLNQQYQNLTKLSEDNLYSMDYFCATSQYRITKMETETEIENEQL